ncbi:hypothetical protein LY90DRAFT_520041 [Neocallimastix californiae]|uniref:Uncharacterized protein n=1 Tax=Neocallimastix californiae TaxID=1754190 RepID=A0A1Y1YJ33_9FUNG|nr:hypothetical protein LY90DRAFT_520041 [Neocallimastix californiae]|eukprot:ORX97766.1 hypothetical protein LY90DRAFT_520041 [Neocallimastix californiae]
MFNGKNIATGPLIYIERDSRLVLKKFEIENIHLKNDGAIIYAINPNKKGANVQTSTSNFKNIYQNNDNYAPALFNISRNNGIIQFRETDIMEFTSKYPEPVFLVDFINEIEVQDTG